VTNDVEAKLAHSAGKATRTRLQHHPESKCEHSRRQTNHYSAQGIAISHKSPAGYCPCAFAAAGWQLHAPRLHCTVRVPLTSYPASQLAVQLAPFAPPLQPHLPHDTHITARSRRQTNHHFVQGIAISCTNPAGYRPLQAGSCTHRGCIALSEFRRCHSLHRSQLCSQRRLHPHCSPTCHPLVARGGEEARCRYWPGLQAATGQGGRDKHT
jgi:hypothetical protein